MNSVISMKLSENKKQAYTKVLLTFLLITITAMLMMIMITMIMIMIIISYFVDEFN